MNKNGKSLSQLFRSILLSLLFVFLTTHLTAADEYLAFAEKMPEVVGGIAQVYKQITYPETARKSGVQGKVYVLVFINESGTVEDAKVVKGIGAGCDEAAIAALKSSKFSPGINGGSPVKVKLAMAIEFKLN